MNKLFNVSKTNLNLLVRAVIIFSLWGMIFAFPIDVSANFNDDRDRPSDFRSTTDRTVVLQEKIAMLLKLVESLKAQVRERQNPNHNSGCLEELATSGSDRVRWKEKCADTDLTDRSDKNQFQIGSMVVTTDNLTVRAEPAGNRIGRASAGTKGKIIDGPETIDGHTWWKLTYSQPTAQATGWSAEAWLKQAADTTNRCPVYQEPVCSDGEVVKSEKLTNGCYAAPQCVPDTDSSDDRGNSYLLRDVQSVVAKEVDPILNAIDDEYTLFVITLKDKTVREVKRYGLGLPTAFEAAVRKTGYIGDVDMLIALSRKSPEACPLVLPPACSGGTALVSKGTGSNGCSLGYKCVSSEELFRNSSSQNGGTSDSDSNSTWGAWGEAKPTNSSSDWGSNKTYKILESRGSGTGVEQCPQSIGPECDSRTLPVSAYTDSKGCMLVHKCVAN